MCVCVCVVCVCVCVCVCASLHTYLKIVIIFIKQGDVRFTVGFVFLAHFVYEIFFALTGVNSSNFGLICLFDWFHC